MKNNGVYVILNQRGCGRSFNKDVEPNCLECLHVTTASQEYCNECGSYFSHFKPVWYELNERSKHDERRSD